MENYIEQLKDEGNEIHFPCKIEYKLLTHEAAYDRLFEAAKNMKVRKVRRAGVFGTLTQTMRRISKRLHQKH